MQMKKRLLVRNAARQHSTSRYRRQQKEEYQHAQVAEEKAAGLITSSARKQRNVKHPSQVLSKKSRDSEAAKITARSDAQNVCLANGVVRISIDSKECKERTAGSALGTIFSPTFHISKAFGRETQNTVDDTQIFTNDGHFDHQNCEVEESRVDHQNIVISLESPDSLCKEEQKKSDENMKISTRCCNDMNACAIDTCSDKYTMPETQLLMPSTEGNITASRCGEMEIVGGNLSSEVSAIYLAMLQSKLECVDESTQYSMPSDAYMQADEGAEIDDFDPYLFIRNLPELSTVVPTFRPMLLPKQTRSCPPTTLVLDLDETLVHSSLEYCGDADFTFSVNFNFNEHTIYVRCRPHLKDFMERVANLFEVIIFTASQSIYAEKVLNVLDPKRRIFRHRVYRESCVVVKENYLKDLSVLGRDLAHVIIIDNSPQAFGFQVDNGIPIESWFNDRSDQALLTLLPFLESLVRVEDVRPLIAKKFNLREKIAAAVNLFS